MTTDAETVPEYLESLPDDRRIAVERLNSSAEKLLIPLGFEQAMGSVGIDYNVPLSTFPEGYHCTPGEPLPFMTIASQARHLAVYHAGVYADADILQWFTSGYEAEKQRHGLLKLNMGKSCIRFTNPSKIPFELFDRLFEKMSADRWVQLYLESRQTRT